MILLLLASLFFISFLLLWNFLGQKQFSVHGVYAQPGPFYWPKCALFYVLVSLQKMRRAQKSTGEMERVQLFSSSPQAFDAVFFSGSQDGLTLIVATERRPENITYAIVYLLTPSNQVWKASWLPMTKISRTNNESFSGEGIEIQPMEPMRSWSVKFSGQLKNASGEIQDAEMDLIWRSDEQVFNYDTDMSAYATARAFAKETWNDQYFKDLKRAHQTHYEQMGIFSGNVQLGQSSYRVFNMASFRDHSYGEARDWTLMHRYIFHHIMLRDGTKIVSGIVCQPHTCTQLECGFVSSKSGRVVPIDECDLVLANHGESGTPPDQYAFSIKAGGHEYVISVQAKARAAHFLGEKSEAKNVELFVDYQVNGIPGSGIAEWNYRNLI